MICMISRYCLVSCFTVTVMMLCYGMSICYMSYRVNYYYDVIILFGYAVIMLSELYEHINISVCRPVLLHPIVMHVIITTT